MQTLSAPNKAAKVKLARNKKKAARVGDMTVEELKIVIHDTVVESLSELVDPDYDPDEGLEFKPEIAARLEKALKEKSRGRPMAEVLADLGISLD